MNVSSNFREFEGYIRSLQLQIVKQCENLEGESFKRFSWDFKAEAETGKEDKQGGGFSTLVELGRFFEKAGVNVSSVSGVLGGEIAKLLGVKIQDYAACGLSLVLHPHSPMVPSVHFNIRLFELADGSYWFGGGADLTPYALFEEDFKHFHGTLRRGVETIYPEKYRAFKEACDRYFYLPHRKEMRGVGGVFFDYLKMERAKEYELVQALGNVFSESWFPLAEKRKSKDYESAYKLFQQFRHGRYVEFNLLYDRGTIFGLKTGGRVESILMSLPFHVIFTSELPIEAQKIGNTMNPYYQAHDWND